MSLHAKSTCTLRLPSHWTSNLELVRQTIAMDNADITQSGYDAYNTAHEGVIKAQLN